MFLNLCVIFKPKNLLISFLNTIIYRSEFPAQAGFYTSADKCCYRECNSLYRRCGRHVYNCLYDEDCGNGLYCQ